jgi:hypothetical protein
VDANPIDIVITRPGPRTKTPAGGWVKSAPTTLDPQTVTLVLAKRRFNAGVINSEAGEVQSSDWLLIAPLGADIQADDEFVAYGDNYTVKSINHVRLDEFFASVENNGRVNRE